MRIRCDRCISWTASSIVLCCGCFSLFWRLFLVITPKPAHTWAMATYRKYNIVFGFLSCNSWHCIRFQLSMTFVKWYSLGIGILRLRTYSSVFPCCCWNTETQKKSIGNKFQKQKIHPTRNRQKVLQNWIHVQMSPFNCNVSEQNPFVAGYP